MTKPLQVLVVEDSADDADLMLLELRRGGYDPSAERVETAADFSSALALRNWDVILCDNSIPELDARGALGLLRNSGMDVPLVVVSGTIGEERAVELMREGAADFVMKGNLGRLVPAVEREARQAVERSKQRRAELEARDLAAIVASSDDAIVGKNLDGAVTSWNAGAERLYGYAAGEIVGRSILPIISPDRPNEEPELLGRVTRGERVEHFETERVRKDGTRIHVSVTLSPVRNDAGKVVGASSIARDITLRKQADERQARDALLLANVRDAVVVTDPSGVVTYWNGGAERLFGWTAAEMVGKPYADSYPEPERTLIADGLRRRAAEEEWAGEFESRRKDGSRVWIDARVSRITDPAGNVVGVLGLSQDITDRKRAEEALHASEERYRTVVADQTEVVCRVRADGTFLFVNDVLCRLVGKSSEELLRRACWSVPHPEDVSRVASALATLSPDNPIVRIEHRILDADGQTRWMEFINRGFFGPGGELREFQAVGRDITEREALLRHIRAEQERLAEVFEQAPSFMCVLRGPEHVFERANDRYMQLLGRRDLLGKPVRDAVPEAEGQGFFELLDGVYRTGEPCVGTGARLLLARRSGQPPEERYVDFVYQALRDPSGVITGVVVVGVDVTARQEADKEIRESEARYRSLADAMPQIVWATNSDGYPEFFNRQWYDYTGLTLEESKGDGWAAAFHPDDQALTWDRWRHTLATGDPFEIEHRCRRRDGEYRWFLCRALPQRDADGRTVRWFGTCTDVHDLKQAQAERYAALARLNLQIERMPLAYLLTGPDFRFTGWNPVAERTFGFTQAEAVGRHPFEIVVPPQSQALVAEILARLAAGDMDANGVCENITKDGRTITCEWYNTPLFGPDGTFLGVLSLSQDITARIRTAESLNFSEARYRRLFEAAQDGILIVDPATRKVFDVNPFLTNLTGYSREEFIGKELWEIGLFKDIESSKASFAMLQEKGYIRYEGLPLAAKNGRKVDVEFVSNVYAVGDTQVIQCNIRDITARKQSEEALRLRDRAIQAVVGGILITDATAHDNPIIYVSPGFEHLTGYTEAESIGRNCRFLQGKDTDPAVVSEVREAVRQGVPCDVELLNYRKDATAFWNALSVSPIQDDGGRVTHFIGFLTDVTRRRKLEDQFHQAQKMEAVGQLASGVAHDFNNLLTVINGYSSIVHNALPAGDPSREFVAEITKAGDRAADLTRQLLAFSRQAVLEPKVLDPNALVRGVEKMLRRLIGEDVDLASKLAPDLGRVKADPGQLEQAVVNLCVNARDAMPTGGSLTIETRNVELDETYVATRPGVRPGPYVVLAVSDTGTGMTREVQARIFEPFFTTKEFGKGTGLGLAMVFGFVKQSGGHLAVYSEVGHGTTFKLYFPQADDAPPAGKSGNQSSSMPKGTETILLVEDEAAVRALGRHILALCGYAVLEAGNGRDAVKAADGHAGPIHLLVSDVVMPGGMGGRQVAEAVVARHPEAKVLFTSGYTDDAVVRHGVLNAGTHFLQKPFTPTTLAQKVRDVLDGKR